MPPTAPSPARTRPWSAGYWPPPAAKRGDGRHGRHRVAVSPEPNPAGSVFWPAVTRLGGPEFAAAVDYAGLDMYPDVFGPRFTLDQLGRAVDWLLRHFRQEVLPIAVSARKSHPDLPDRLAQPGPGAAPSSRRTCSGPSCGSAHTT